jgi:hypothetical protein
MGNIAFLVIKFSPILALTVAIYALVRFRKLPIELKTFCYFLFVSGLAQLASTIYWLQSKNNLPLLHLYVAAGFFCLAWFYRVILKDFIDEKIIWATVILFTLFTIINSLFIQTIYTFNSYALTVESILVVIFSLSTYMFMMEDIVKRKRTGLIKSLNWINSGLFIYYASSLLIFYYGEFFIRAFPRSFNLFNLQTWMLHTLFLAVMYFCFFMGLWHSPRGERPNQSSE